MASLNVPATKGVGWFMKKTNLQWLGPELVRAGLVQNKRWVLDTAEEVSHMPWLRDMGLLATAAAIVHPHALSIIKSAPIVVAVALPRVEWHNRESRAHRLKQWRAEVEQGQKLRDLLEGYGVPYGMRLLDVGVIDGEMVGPGARKMAVIPASTFAQSMPRGDVKHQRRWILDLITAYDKAAMLGGTTGDRHDRYVAETLTWLAVNWKADVAIGDYGRGTTIIPAMMDYFASRYPEPPNRRWTMERAHVLSTEWHEEMVTRNHETMFRQKWQRGFDDEAPLPAGWPRVAKRIAPKPFEEVAHMVKADQTRPEDIDKYDPDWHDLYEATALTTGRALAEETAAMRHCVANYAGLVHTGRSVIYSITKNGKRVATVELHPSGARGVPPTVGEFKRFANKVVPPRAEERNLVADLRAHIGEITRQSVKAGAVATGVAPEGLTVSYLQSIARGLSGIVGRGV